MRSALVSIIMPVYNGERFLRQAIESVLEQDHQNWELIVADDGSTDGSRQIVEEYQNARIRCYSQPNRGQAAALNLGLGQAKGDYITTLDADDWMPHDSLSKRVEYLDNHPEHGAVYGNGLYCSVDGKPLAQFSDYCISSIAGDLYGKLLVSNTFGTGAAVLIRREAIERAGLRYDEAIVWCQDWDFYLRLAEEITFGYVESKTVFYRLHASNMSMQMPSERQRAAVARTRQKALATRRFQQTAAEEKRRFFYAILREDLRGSSAEQHAVVDSEVFRDMPASEQAALVRLVALDYLQYGANRHICRQWLDMAHKLDPSDRKTGVIAFLFAINADLAKKVVGLYRKRKESEAAKNPFQLIAGL